MWITDRRGTLLRAGLVLAVAVIGVTDVVLPETVVVLPFLLVPLVSSVALGDTRFVLVLLIESAAFDVASTIAHDYTASENAVRAVTLLVVAAIAAWLSRDLRRERATVRVTLEASLDPIMLLRPLPSDRHPIEDFEIVDANAAAAASAGRDPQQVRGARLLATAQPSLVESGLFNVYRQAVESNEPYAVDALRYPGHQGGPERHLDIRARRVEGGLLYVTWRDVSERVRSLTNLAESEMRFRLLAENSHDVVLYLRQGQVEWASPSITSTLGWEAQAVIGFGLVDLVAPEDVAIAEDRYHLSKQGKTSVTRVRLRASDGTVHWAEVHAGPFFGVDGQPSGVVASFRLVDAEVAAEAALLRRAELDDLTGALQRGAVVATLAAWLAEGSHAQVGLLYLDLDDFKQVNDRLGHAAGDRVLMSTVQRVRAALRTGDVVGRLGGDEFVVALRDISGLEALLHLGEKIRIACAEPYTDGAVTVSVGVALAGPGDDAEALLARADAAMFDAKRGGRNQVQTIV